MSGGGVIISHVVLINKMNFCIYVYSEEQPLYNIHTAPNKIIDMIKQIN